MNLYEFLFALGFWQWVGVILLASTLSSGCVALLGAVARIIKSPKK